MRKAAMVGLAALLLLLAAWVIIARITSTSETAGYRYYIVEFKDKITESYKADASTAGAELIYFHHPNGFVARIESSSLDAVRKVQSVRSVDPFPPGLKMDSALQPSIDKNEVVRLVVTTYPGEDLDRIVSAAKRLGGEVLYGPERHTGNRGHMRLSIRGGAVPELARIEGVSSIGLWAEPTLAQ